MWSVVHCACDVHGVNVSGRRGRQSYLQALVVIKSHTAIRIVICKTKHASATVREYARASAHANLRICRRVQSANVVKKRRRKRPRAEKSSSIPCLYERATCDHVGCTREQSLTTRARPTPASLISEQHTTYNTRGTDSTGPQSHNDSSQNRAATQYATQ